MEAVSLLVVMYRILHSRSVGVRALLRFADFDTLHRLNGNDGLREAAIEPGVPGDVRTDAGRQAMRHDFENAADCVARTIGVIDGFFHAGFGFGVDATEKNVIP